MPLPGRLTAIVILNKPHPTCFDCLAKLEGLPEPDISDAAQVDLIRDGLRVVFSACHRCGRLDNGLMAREGDGR